jgi:hypothetical protein
MALIDGGAAALEDDATAPATAAAARGGDARERKVMVPRRVKRRRGEDILHLLLVHARTGGVRGLGELLEGGLHGGDSASGGAVGGCSCMLDEERDARVDGGRVEVLGALAEEDKEVLDLEAFVGSKRWDDRVLRGESAAGEGGEGVDGSGCGGSVGLALLRGRRGRRKRSRGRSGRRGGGADDGGRIILVHPVLGLAHGMSAVRGHGDRSVRAGRGRRRSSALGDVVVALIAVAARRRASAFLSLVVKEAAILTASFAEKGGVEGRGRGVRAAVALGMLNRDTSRRSLHRAGLEQHRDRRREVEDLRSSMVVEAVLEDGTVRCKGLFERLLGVARDGYADDAHFDEVILVLVGELGEAVLNRAKSELEARKISHAELGGVSELGDDMAARKREKGERLGGGLPAEGLLESSSGIGEGDGAPAVSRTAQNSRSQS